MLSPEEVVIKPITPDIWGERDMGQPTMGFRGAVKQKERPHSLWCLIRSQQGRGVMDAGGRGAGGAGCCLAGGHECHSLSHLPPCALLSPCDGC